MSHRRTGSFRDVAKMPVPFDCVQPRDCCASAPVSAAAIGEMRGPARLRTVHDRPLMPVGRCREGIHGDGDARRWRSGGGQFGSGRCDDEHDRSADRTDGPRSKSLNQSFVFDGDASDNDNGNGSNVSIDSPAGVHSTCQKSGRVQRVVLVMRLVHVFVPSINPSSVHSIKRSDPRVRRL